MSLSYLLDALRARVPSDSSAMDRTSSVHPAVQPSDTRTTQLPDDATSARRARPPVAEVTRVHTTLA